MKNPPAVLGLLICSLVVGVVGGQPPPVLPTTLEPALIAPLPAAARNQLDRAEALLQQGLAEEAKDTFRRVMDGYGDSLIRWRTLDAAEPIGFQRYRPLREYGWLRLASLRDTAPSVFQSMRRQMDPQARRWFEATTGPAGAFDERLVEELFLSSHADEALLRLGDAALERGQYNAARRYWERLGLTLRFPPVSDGPWFAARHRPLWLPFVQADWEQAWPIASPWFTTAGEPSELFYPDTNVPLADVRGRLVVASLLEGNRERATIELELLRRLAPDARGTLGGKSATWVELLSELSQQSAEWPEPKPAAGWSELGGNSARNGVLPPLAVVAEKPIWSAPLPRWTVEQEWLSSHRARVAEDADNLLPYHPVVSDGIAYVQTRPERQAVRGYRLRTGESALPLAEEPDLPAKPMPGGEQVGAPRFPLCVDRNRLYLLDGWPMLANPENRSFEPARLQAIDVAAERRLLWEFQIPPTDRGQPLQVGGPATTDGVRVYVVLRRREAARNESYLAALDARDGRLLWKRLIGSSDPVVDARWNELTYQLATVHQGTVYCHANQGFVAALDARTGRPLWTTTYPRTGWRSDNPDANHLHAFRDLTPCLVHHDTLVVAPADSNRIFALDATTGIPLWVLPAERGADAIHLLGVAGRSLVVAGECVYWLDIRTGKSRGMYAEPFLAAPGFARPIPRGYGRGLLAGTRVYWPTRDEILVFDARDSGLETWRPEIVAKIPLAPHGATGGNLVWADGVLLVASADRLLAWEAPLSTATR